MRFRIQDSGFLILGIRGLVLGFRFSGFMVQGFVFRVQGSVPGRQGGVRTHAPEGGEGVVALLSFCTVLVAEAIVQSILLPIKEFLSRRCADGPIALMPKGWNGVASCKSGDVAMSRP